MCCCLNTTVVVGWQIGAVATMGLFDKLANMLKMKKEQINILVVGLNNSGKSTIVNHFKNPNERTSIVVPTVGFSVERFESEYQLHTLKCSTFLIISPAIHVRNNCAPVKREHDKMSTKRKFQVTKDVSILPD